MHPTKSILPLKTSERHWNRRRRNAVPFATPYMFLDEVTSIKIQPYSGIKWMILLRSRSRFTKRYLEWSFYPEESPENWLIQLRIQNLELRWFKTIIQTPGIPPSLPSYPHTTTHITPFSHFPSFFRVWSTFSSRTPRACTSIFPTSKSHFSRATRHNHQNGQATCAHLTIHINPDPPTEPSETPAINFVLDLPPKSQASPTHRSAHPPYQH